MKKKRESLTCSHRWGKETLGKAIRKSKGQRAEIAGKGPRE
jgi:hypothetical protein